MLVNLLPYRLVLALLVPLVPGPLRFDSTWAAVWLALGTWVLWSLGDAVIWRARGLEVFPELGRRPPHSVVLIVSTLPAIWLTLVAWPLPGVHIEWWGAGIALGGLNAAYLGAVWVLRAVFGPRHLAVCPVPVGGAGLLAVGGRGAKVCLIDPRDGDLRRELPHEGQVNALCTIAAQGRTLLAVAGYGRFADLWDPDEGVRVTFMKIGHSVHALCEVPQPDRTLLALGSVAGGVILWEPGAPVPARVMSERGAGVVFALCAVRHEGRTLVASGHRDGRVRLWDPRTGELLRRHDAHRFGVRAMWPFDVDGQPLLASAGGDGVVRVFDPWSGEDRLRSRPDARSSRNALFGLCGVETKAGTVLAAGGDEGGIRLLNPLTGERVAHLDAGGLPVRGVCRFDTDGRSYLAAVGWPDAGAAPARLWDLDTVTT